jgi:hypothetical protein
MISLLTTSRLNSRETSIKVFILRRTTFMINVISYDKYQIAFPLKFQVRSTLFP